MQRGPKFQLTVLYEEDTVRARQEFKEHVIQGLSLPLKTLSSKYFYNDRGSARILSTYRTELYTQITELEEYYLTASEKSIFKTHADDIVRKHFSSQQGPLNLIELGAGDGRKTKILIQALLDRHIAFEYIPIDISRRAMSTLFEAMGDFFRKHTFSVHGIVGEYLEAVKHVVSAHPARRCAVLFIGSSIGNVHMEPAIQFLSELRRHLQPADVFLMGCDLLKDSEVMRRAYADAKGITRAFNLNLLKRMNEELGTDFDLTRFQHLAIYNPRLRAMESYLVATTSQKVTMKFAGDDESRRGDAAQEFVFDAFEPLYLECSHKYTFQSIDTILTDAGFIPQAKYSDEKDWFVDTVSYVPSR